MSNLGDTFWVIKSRETPARYYAASAKPLVGWPDEAVSFRDEIEADLVAQGLGMRKCACRIISFRDGA